MGLDRVEAQLGAVHASLHVSKVRGQVLVEDQSTEALRVGRIQRWQFWPRKAKQNL